MPNWCSNNATITATTEEARDLLKRYKQFLSGNPMKNDFFGWFVPPPEGQTNFLGWANASWGSKWDVEMSLDSIKGDVIFFAEDTAWTPPTEFYHAMVNLGFDVEANYYEPGCGFYGRFSNGEDESTQIPTPSKEWSYLKWVNESPGLTIQLGPEFQISDLKPGDHLIKGGETLAIYVDHKFVLWEDFKRDNEVFFDPLIQEFNPEIQVICEVEQDFYVFDVIRDPTKIGSDKAIMLVDSKELMFFEE